MKMRKKDTISVIVVTVGNMIKYFIENMNHLHLKYHWQN